VWSETVAQRLTIDDVRRVARAPRLDAEAVEAAQCVECAPAQDALTCDLPMHLLRDLGSGDRATLQLLIAGVHSSLAIAEIRGCTLRAVQQSRRRIRAVAARAGMSPDCFIVERPFL